MLWNYVWVTYSVSSVMFLGVEAQVAAYFPLIMQFTNGDWFVLVEISFWSLWASKL